MLFYTVHASELIAKNTMAKNPSTNRMLTKTYFNGKMSSALFVVVLVDVVLGFDDSKDEGSKDIVTTSLI
jgi:hypothetical protein